jgi:uncharacterized protein YjiS (DUF1127 family)
MSVDNHAQQRGRSQATDQSIAIFDPSLEASHTLPTFPPERKRGTSEEEQDAGRSDSRLFHRIRPEVLFSDFAPMVMVSPAVWEYASTGDGDERRPWPVLRLLSLALRPIAWIGGRILNWMMRDRERRHLHGLSDHMLKDIGLSRADIERRTRGHRRYL